MSTDLVPSGGGAVAVTGGGGTVTLSDQVGDVSVDRGRGVSTSGARPSAPAGVDPSRVALFADWAKTVGASDAQLRQTQAWLLRPNTQDLLGQERASKDQRESAALEKSLRSRWGGRYGANIARIKSFLESLHPEVAAEIWHARDVTGTAICNKAGFVEGLLTQASSAAYRQSGPAQASDLSAELRQLNSMMANTGSAYYQGPDATRNQERYRELLEQGVTTDSRPPGSAEQADARIAEIESLMRKSGSEYFRGPNSDAIQREYRDLINQRDQSRRS